MKQIFTTTIKNEIYAANEKGIIKTFANWKQAEAHALNFTKAEAVCGSGRAKLVLVEVI